MLAAWPFLGRRSSVVLASELITRSCSFSCECETYECKASDHESKSLVSASITLTKSVGHASKKRSDRSIVRSMFNQVGLTTPRFATSVRRPPAPLHSHVWANPKGVKKNVAREKNTLNIGFFSHNTASLLNAALVRYDLRVPPVIQSGS